MDKLKVCFIKILQIFLDFEQKTKIVLEPSTDEPITRSVNTDEKPFVLNPGKWQLKINSIKRLFLVKLKILNIKCLF